MKSGSRSEALATALLSSGKLLRLGGPTDGFFLRLDGMFDSSATAFGGSGVGGDRYLCGARYGERG